MLAPAKALLPKGMGTVESTEIVDTHCHIHEILASPLNDATHDKWVKADKTDVDKVIADARAAGVTKLICVGTDADDSRLAVDFVQPRLDTWASIGIHPHEAKRYAGDSRALDAFAALVSRPKVVAIGECGLDYFYNHSPKAAQIELLRFQIELALKHELPMIFHVREAFGDFWPVFDEYTDAGQQIRGVIHSFSAGERELDAILKRNLYVGLNGIVTFTKDPAQIAVFQSVPSDRLLIETDAPYLTPAPYRGNVNESKYAAINLSFVAKLKGKQAQLLAAQTTNNARQLFSLPG